MFVNDNLRNCVVFVGFKTQSGYEIGGTAFFLLWPIENSDHYSLYAVTARHVITAACQRSIDGHAYFRVNVANGMCEWLKTEAWGFHDDERVDIAATRMNWNETHLMGIYDHGAISWNNLLDDEAIAHLKISPGEDLFFPGLFVRYPGEIANLPILRTGTIAAIPKSNQLIATALGVTDAYLAEIKSIGGHSGSPVFVYFDSTKLCFLEQNNLEHGESYPLLGVVHGHFPLDRSQFTYSEVKANAPTKETFSSGSDFHSGIAVIVPAYRIREAFSQEQFVNERRDMAKHFAKKNGKSPTEKTRSGEGTE